jgi:hypothetical protein
MHSEFGGLDVLPEPGPLMFHVYVLFLFFHQQNTEHEHFFRIFQKRCG